jgi:hypothetical protein
MRAVLPGSFERWKSAPSSDHHHPIKGCASKSRQQAIKQATHGAVCLKRRHETRITAHGSVKVLLYRQRLKTAVKKASRLAVRKGLFSPLPPAEITKKVSPFCHIKQQTNAKTAGEPSQTSRDNSAFRIIRQHESIPGKLSFSYIFQRLI